MVAASCSVGAAHHPEVVTTTLELLWSINERLAGREGIDVPPPSLAFLQDVSDVARIQCEERERVMEEIQRNAHRH